MHPIGFGLFTFADATLTPHGDDNYSDKGIIAAKRGLDATLTPHGDDNFILIKIVSITSDATLTPHGDRKNTTLSDCVQRHMVRKGRIHFPLFNSEIFPSSTKAPSNYKTPILNQSESGRRSNQLIHFLIVQ